MILFYLVSVCPATLAWVSCYVAPKDSDLIREQLLRKIEAGFNASINAARIAKLPREELQKLFEFTLKENQYE